MTDAPPESEGTPPEHSKGLKARYTSTRERIVDAEHALQASRPQRPWVNLGYCIIERDAERGGGLIAGALAYRVFFWVLPFSLVLVGVLGFAAASDEKAPQDLAKTAGVVGFASQSIAQAAVDSQNFRFWAIAIGVPALYLASLSFVKALRVAHGLLWGVPPGRMRKKPVAALAMTLLLIGLMVAFALENRIREEWAGPGLIAALLFVFIAAGLWLFVAYFMPRPEGTTWLHILPGAFAVAVGCQIVHLITIYYVSRKVSGASVSYGALGAAAGILLSLFFLARVVVIATVLNAELWARRETRRTGEVEPAVRSPLILDQ